MSKSIAILGFGPSAVFAARAAVDLGHTVTIFSQDSQFNVPPGAFWLHWVPEHVCHRDPVAISIYGSGTGQGYLMRQWGSALSEEELVGVTSSFPSSMVQEKGWDPAELRSMVPPFHHQVIKKPMDRGEVDAVAGSFDLVFQTFPMQEHKAEQPPLLPFVAAGKRVLPSNPRNEVWYNGSTYQKSNKDYLVRDAYLFGMHYMEFAKGIPVEEVRQFGDVFQYELVTLKDLHPLSKPRRHPNPKVHLLGRMAMWDRKFLSHDAYTYVQEVLHG